MDGNSLPLLPLRNPSPADPPDDACTSQSNAVIIAHNPLIAHGVARILERAGAIGSVEIHPSIEAAMNGPVAALVIVHPDMLDLRVAQVTDLVRRRQAVALLAAGTGHGPGIAALRAAGAQGTLNGTEAPGLCASMIRLVLAGGSCWTAEAVFQMATDRSNCTQDNLSLLTPRQREIARELVQGRGNKVIAFNLGITEGTVKIHLTAIFRTLGVQSRSAAVACLVRLLDPASCGV